MNSETPHSATYSPQDDKIRLYFAFRIPRDEWDSLKKAGFSWTMKQAEAGGCDMSAPWTPEREDIALAMAGEIDDEDQPREERAAQRAERFEGYQHKRLAEATGYADKYESGPSVHGHQNAARAERAAARHDRIGTRAGTQWDKAEYWTARTAGVIRHALYVERAEVRHRRIKGLEADIRRLEKEHAQRVARYETWEKLAKVEDPAKQTEYAEAITGHSSPDWDFKHPDKPELEPQSLWTLIARHGLTGAQACALYFERYADPRAGRSRWLAHYEMRLAYEKQMLAAQGGTSADIEIIPGGFYGRHQVQKISKDKCGRISKVWFKNADGRLDSIDAEKLKAEDYRQPTPEEAAAFAQAKAEGKAGAKKQVPLLNPTKEAAQALCDMWNAATDARKARDKAKYEYGICESNYGHAKVIEMTAQEWTANSKRGDFYAAREMDVSGRVLSRWDHVPGVAAFRVRLRHTMSGSSHVVTLTDKPGVALPIVAPAPIEQEAAK